MTDLTRYNYTGIPLDYKNIPLETRIIENRPRESYPQNLLNEFALITINKDNYMVIGSASYKIQKYPSDLDLLEVIELCCSETTVVKYFITHFKKIVKNILNKRTHYFIEVKCGLDDRYILDPGPYNQGHFQILPEFIEAMANLHADNLLSDEEWTIISEINNKQNANQLDYEIIFKLLRNRYIIRWSAKEILAGFKILPGNIKLTLDNAVRQKSQINIEIISLINGKFTDESNFFILAYKDQQDNTFMINLPQAAAIEGSQYVIDGLKASIEKLYFSKLDFNPFKMCKRIWSLARLQHDEFLIKKMLPIITSNISFASQVKSYIGTLIKLIEKTKSPPYISIFKELQNMKTDITNILQIGNTAELNIDKKIDSISNYKGKSRGHIIEVLKSLKRYLDNKVNKVTIEYLKSINFVPPPDYLLPDYDKRIF